MRVEDIREGAAFNTLPLALTTPVVKEDLCEINAHEKEQERVCVPYHGFILISQLLMMDVAIVPKGKHPPNPVSLATVS